MEKRRNRRKPGKARKKERNGEGKEMEKRRRWRREGYGERN
jgi:hypothetical protein